VHYSVPSRVQQKKFGKLWSTCYGDLDVQLYVKNRLFWKTTFRPLEGTAVQNLYTRHKMAKSC